MAELEKYALNDTSKHSLIDKSLFGGKSDELGLMSSGPNDLW